MPNIKFDRGEVQRQFIAALHQHGLELASEGLIADGEWQRCDVAKKKGHSGRGDGSYKLSLNSGWPWGLYQDWTRDRRPTAWRFKTDRKPSAREWVEIKREWARAQKESEERLRQKRAAAQEEAQTIWHKSPAANPSHPYLKAKHLDNPEERLRIKQNREGQLLVPVYSNATEEIVNLQFITGNGNKFTVTGGQLSACHYWLRKPKDYAAEFDLRLGEGWATGATIRYAENDTAVLMSFGGKNLKAAAEYARERCPNARITIARDDDWKTEGNPGLSFAREAARAVGALIATPDFTGRRADGDTDFNDLYVRHGGIKAVRRSLRDARPVPADAEAKGGQEEDNETSEDNNELAEAFEELAQLDPLDYERIRKQKRDELGIRVSVLDREVEARRKQAVTKTETASAPSITELAQAARDIIDCEDVLDAFLRASDPGIAGEETVRKMLYLTATTRLFAKPMSAALKGPSSVGKSHTRDYVLRFFPPEDVIQFTSLTEKALYYFPGEFSHKILSLGEAGNPEEQTFQDLIVRQLMSEGVLRHLMTAKQPDGSLETMVIEKRGPVCFLVTTTRTTLHEENETRMLSLENDDSARQTRRVLKQIALTEGLNRSNAPLDLEDWIAFQRWLAAGETKVFVPFAEVLQELIEDHYSLRLRRDFNQLLDAIKAHALLHREHRKRSTKGSIIATIDEDYAAIEPLMADLMATAEEMKVRGAVLDVVDKLKQMVTENPAFAHEPDAGITVRQITRRLRLDRSSTYRRLSQALEMGLVKNMEGRRGRPARYLPTNERPRTAQLLPSVKDLKDAHAENRLSKEEKPARGCAKSRK
jgi:phage/plasmid primase-like uncharacterized protein